MDPDARFRSPVALRAARRDHTTLDVVLLSALLLLAALIWTTANVPTSPVCDGYSQAFCATHVDDTTTRPS